MAILEGGVRNESDINNFFNTIFNNEIEVSGGVTLFAEPSVTMNQVIAIFNQALATGNFLPDENDDYSFVYNGHNFSQIGNVLNYTNAGSVDFSGNAEGETNYNLTVGQIDVQFVNGELTRDLDAIPQTSITLSPFTNDNDSGRYALNLLDFDTEDSHFETYRLELDHDVDNPFVPSDSLEIAGQLSIDEVSGKVQGTVNVVGYSLWSGASPYAINYYDLSVDFQELMGASGTVDAMEAFLLAAPNLIEGTPENDPNLFGTNEEDVIYGLSGDDEIYGRLGDDVIYGQDGDDVIYGGGGEGSGVSDNDTLYGGEGSDILIGYSGDDILNGGAGVDTALYSHPTAIENVIYARQFSNGQVVVRTESEGSDTLINIENIAFSTDNNGVPDAMPMSEFLAQVPDIPPVGMVTFTGVGENGETVALSPTVYAGPVDFLEFELLGASEGDTVTGSDFNDFINLLGGDDAAVGGDGVDVLDGGTGSNFLTGGNGADTFYLDGRGGLTTWSTIADFGGDNVNIWGWVEGVSALLLTQALNGADGFQGVTFHYDLNNDGAIDTSITFTGLTEEQVPSSSAQTVADNGYLLFA